MGLTHSSDMGDYDYQHVTATGTISVGRRQVNTTASTAVAAPGSATITPTSMNNIEVNLRLKIFGGVGTTEWVQVTATTATTFTATFLNTHSGTYNIVSQKNCRLGRVVTNTKGTGDTITLYNGHPSDSPAGDIVAVLTPSTTVPTVEYGVKFPRGLWAVLAGTPGDYTFCFIELLD